MLNLIFSPYNYIDNQTPPTIIFHGKNDKTIDPRTVVLFNQKMKKFGNCKLYLYGKEHGFFNYGLELNGPFVDTIRKLDNFLVNLGYIESHSFISYVKYLNKMLNRLRFKKKTKAILVLLRYTNLFFFWEF